MPTRLQHLFRGLSFGFALLAATPAFAQSAIGGTVTDPQAAVVAGAQVTLAAGSNELRTVQTDAQGRYRFEAVAAGPDTVAVAAPSPPPPQPSV